MTYDTDFTVDIPSTFFMEYREGNHVMKVEMDFRDEFPILTHRAIKAWESPFSNEKITTIKKCEIINNLIFYLNEIRRFKFEVDGGDIVESRIYGDN
jgi:hypothetical protein